MARPKIDIPPEDWARILNDWQRGLSPATIAREHGINRNTLVARMRRGGIKRGAPQGDTPSIYIDRDDGGSLCPDSGETALDLDQHGQGQDDGQETGGDVEAVATVPTGTLPPTGGTTPWVPNVARMQREHDRRGRRLWSLFDATLRQAKSREAPSVAELHTLAQDFERLVRLDKQAAGIQPGDTPGPATTRAQAMAVIIVPPKAGITSEAWREAVMSSVVDASTAEIPASWGAAAGVGEGQGAPAGDQDGGDAPAGEARGRG